MRMTRILQPYECCHCGKGRGDDANHWWLLWQSMETVFAMPWNDEFKDTEGVEHVCGLECLTVRFERLILTVLTRRIEKEKTAREQNA
jgi:hypothetical protein